MDNLEEKILNTIDWKEKDYNGNLVYNIITDDNTHISDIVCAKRNNFIEIKLFNIEPLSDPIVFHYSTENNTIDETKSDPSFSDKESVSLFLNKIKEFLKDNESNNQISFFPTEKIIKNNNKNKMK